MYSRVALISDIHGNLLALEMVLEDVEREGVDGVVCLGDVAATGPWPSETVDRLRSLDCPVVMGNADDELLRPGVLPEDEGSRRIAEIDRWCAGRLSADQLDWVCGFHQTLEVTLRGGRTLLCFHGSPRSFDEGVTPETPAEDLARMFSGHHADVMAGTPTSSSCVGTARRSYSIRAASASTLRGQSMRSYPPGTTVGWR